MQHAKTRGKRAEHNREFAVITYVFLAVFIGMMGYFVYFMAFQSEDFINSPYNARQDSFAKRVVRGEIRSADGHVLAKTLTMEDGTEYRYYPYGKMFAHVVGYSTNGKSGIESITNFNLLRSHTFFLEKIIHELKGEKSPGDHVVTTLDFELQETAYKALGDYDGAIVVIEPFTGKILAMVSKPDFNPNEIEKEWDALVSEENESSVLLNRATQGLYPPGSVFKIVTTLEYMHENPDYESYSFDCGGSFSSGKFVIHCYNNSSHGKETLKDSFADSCNASYASLGLTLDLAQYTKLCNSLLFNTSLPTRFESSKSTFSLTEDASEWDIMQTAIGQGKTLVTPFHMALIACAAANNGVLMNPYVIDHTENEKGVMVKQYEPSEYGVLLAEEDAAVLKEYMGAVVEYGTGEKLSGQSYEAYGKTGSAEFSTVSDSCHSWFIGYAHKDGKEDIAIAVLVEDSGVGSKYALPMAKNIFDVYFSE